MSANTFSAGTSAVKRLSLIVTILLSLALSGCASFYVDTGTPDVPPSAMKKVVQPVPVQLLFEFQTKGVANTRATDFLRSQVFDQVRASGLFSQVEDKPVAGGTLLGIKLDNVPLSDDAFSKGFVTGLTFGLAGNQVSDGYVCTITYVGSDGQRKIEKKALHAIHTTVGAKDGPANGIKADSAEAAVTMMARQIVGTALKDLSFDPDFK